MVVSSQKEIDRYLTSPSPSPTPYQVVGSAIAFKILFGWPLWVGTLVTGADTFTFLILQFFGMRKLEALFVALVFTMTVCL